MFNKRVLASGLVAMAISLGAQAMHQGKQAQGKNVLVEEIKSAQKGKQSQQAQSDCDDESSSEEECGNSQQSQQSQVVVEEKGSCDQSQQASQCDNSQQASQCDNSQMSQSFGQEITQAGCGATIMVGQCSRQLDQNADWGQLLHGDFSHYHVHGHHWTTRHHVRWTKHSGLKLSHNCFTDSRWSKLRFAKSAIMEFNWNGPMYKVTFAKSHIHQSTMRGHLLGVSFEHTKITNTSFHGAYFGLADGRRSKIMTSFVGAELDNVNFSGAIFAQGVSFHGAKIGHNVNFVGAYIETSNGLVLVTADMAAHIVTGFGQMAQKGITIGTFLIDGGFTLVNVAGNLVHGAVDAVVGGLHGVSHGVLSGAVNAHMTLSHFFNDHGVYTGACGASGASCTNVAVVSSCNSNAGSCN